MLSQIFKFLEDKRFKMKILAAKVNVQLIVYLEI